MTDHVCRPNCALCAEDERLNAIVTSDGAEGANAWWSTQRRRGPRRSPHGTRNRYASGCACEPCKTAAREWARNWRAGKRKDGLVFNRGRLQEPSPRATGRPKDPERTGQPVPVPAARTTSAGDGWIADRACRDVDTEIFFPTRQQDWRPAKRICAACPVAAECLNYALKNQIEHGIWGGTSERERRRMRRALRLTAA